MTDIHPLYQCPGCKQKFTEKAAYLGLCVVHKEQDYIAGTKMITGLRNRIYHLSVRCINERHKEFRPTTTGLLTECSETLLDLTAPQLDRVLKFKRGELY